jgi:twitching motility protein PilT
MKAIDHCITYGRQQGCSDIHLTPGEPILFRRVGKLETLDFPVSKEETEQMIDSLLSDEQRKEHQKGNDIDFSYAIPDGSRQRVNIFRERKRTCCAIRLLNENIPTLEELFLPSILKKLALLPRGLILVTGPTGSGKSTTLAAMVNYINKNRQAHILTIEDPIEYIYQNQAALIHQREVSGDTSSFASALRSSLREDPDVILVGEMRDHETISAALTAAETGHLVLSTLHTTGAANTIDRIIDVFPTEGQRQIRTQLSGVLQGVITQQLLPTADGEGRIAALEILVGTDAVRNLIRDSKCHQLRSIIQTGAKDGMKTLPQDLSRLIQEKKITYDEALTICSEPQELQPLTASNR